MRWRSLLRLALVLLAFLAAASWGISRALAGGWGRRPLLARLSASFGRPVDVGRFNFNLLAGPQLEADSVTVAEDPRFGSEYFLRADQITARLAWLPLLRGRIEFRTLTLTGPSLNLVRTADGAWNIEYWLPPAPPAPASSAATPPGTPAVSARVAHIEVDGGRINFKRGAEKLEFALTDVMGSLDQDPSGRWSLDLEAHPERASVVLQDVGSLRLRGTVAGTSARLRPAHLALTWQDASLADAVRLARGTDYGMRGTLGAEFSASIETPGTAKDGGSSGEWLLQGTVRLAGVHRWDLVARASDPALNLRVASSWRPGEPSLEVTHYVVESPHSQLAGSGRINWARGFVPTVQVITSRIDLGDLLAWRRAFASTLAEDLAVDGAIQTSAKIVGWPPRVEEAELASAGATIRTAALPGAIHVGAMQVELQRGVLALAPVPVDFPGVPASQPLRSARGSSRATAPTKSVALAGTLRVGGEIGPFRAGAWPKEWTYRLVVNGETSRAQDVTALSTAFGWPIRTDWTYEGAVALQLAWAGALGSANSPPSGKLDLRDFRLATAMLNQPVTISAASVELGRAGRRVKLADAQAFGARWTGTMERPSGDRGWTFDLVADRLDVADLDRWLGPRARPGFFQRMMPFSGAVSQTPALETVIARINGKGRLRIGELQVAPLRLTKVDAGADLDGRNVRLVRAQADLYGGSISGDFTASVSAEPAYSFRGAVDRVNLALLADATAELAGRFAGVASGDLSLAAKGIGRQALLSSLEGDGALRVRDAVVPIVNAAWVEEGEESAPQTAGVSRFTLGTLAFRVADGDVHLDPLRLTDREHEFEVTGAVNFSRRLDLRVRPLPRGADAAPVGAAPVGAWSIAGTLDAPQVKRLASVAANAAGTAGARR